MLLVVCSAALFSGCNMHYSDGVRTGVIVKFSKKGIFNKTWEGTMLTGLMENTEHGMVAEKFHFSVTDEAVATKLNTVLSLNKKIELHYDQLLFTDMFVSPDSNYRIVDVKVLE